MRVRAEARASPGNGDDRFHGLARGMRDFDPGRRMLTPLGGNRQIMERPGLRGAPDRLNPDRPNLTCTGRRRGPTPALAFEARERRSLSDPRVLVRGVDADRGRMLRRFVGPRSGFGHDARRIERRPRLCVSPARRRLPAHHRVLGRGDRCRHVRGLGLREPHGPRQRAPRDTGLAGASGRLGAVRAGSLVGGRQPRSLAHRAPPAGSAGGGREGRRPRAVLRRGPPRPFRAHRRRRGGVERTGGRLLPPVAGFRAAGRPVDGRSGHRHLGGGRSRGRIGGRVGVADRPGRIRVSSRRRRRTGPLPQLGPPRGRGTFLAGLLAGRST